MKAHWRRELEGFCYQKFLNNEKIFDVLYETGTISHCISSYDRYVSEQVNATGSIACVQELCTEIELKCIKGTQVNFQAMKVSL